MPRAAADLEAAVAALQNDSAVDGSKVGCIGFCMGGQLALLAATRDRRIAAVVDCYGVHPRVSLELDGLEAAVLGIFAEHDEFIPLATVRELETQLREAGKRAHMEIIPGAQHAFLNATRPEVYDVELATSVWDRILAFLRAELPV
jgi:carboxymethylenebutenolidase